MCQKPITTAEGNTFSCRECDQCVSSRRFDWVSRAMAERATRSFSLSVTLTYSDETQHSRDGAAMFRYSDIQLFLARLRDNIKFHHKITGDIRYLVAGEQGERHGRVHWHMIIFSDLDLTTVGDFSGPNGPITDRDDLVTVYPAKVRRRHWNLWPHGFVSLQEADEGGVHYAITYALKDQFSMQKAGTSKRAAKSETFATGMFRMSKYPPIGWEFIRRKLEALAEMGAVLPKPTLTVPDLRGFWYPRGESRKFLLTGLKQINDQIREQTGRDAPQWSSLVHSCEQNPKDMEILLGQEEQESFEDLARDIKSRTAFNQSVKDISKIRRKCGSSAPCTECVWQYLYSERHEFEASNTDQGFFFRYKENDPQGIRLAKAQTDGACKGINPLCLNTREAELKIAFPSSYQRKNSQSPR